MGVQASLETMAVAALLHTPGACIVFNEDARFVVKINTAFPAMTRRSACHMLSPISSSRNAA